MKRDKKKKKCIKWSQYCSYVMVEGHGLLTGCNFYFRLVTSSCLIYFSFQFKFKCKAETCYKHLSLF